jgi:hypothetical protein
MSTSPAKSNIQACRNVLGQHGILTDPLADRSDGFVRDAKIACYVTQAFTLGLGRSCRALLTSSARSLSHQRIAPRARLLSGAAAPLPVEERDEGYFYHIYLA